jgi:hypothetical protein
MHTKGDGITQRRPATDRGEASLDATSILAQFADGRHPLIGCP